MPDILEICDVFLDCPAFSGYTTAWQAAHAGLPMVTLQGEFLRQRLAAGLLCRIGMNEMIAGDENEYVAIAARLAHETRDPERRRARRLALRRAAPLADEDLSVVRAFERTVGEELARR
jgi:predicted O-linked N-acetylglucosamine transferase (SPINDLY family)